MRKRQTDWINFELWQPIGLTTSRKITRLSLTFLTMIHCIQFHFHQVTYRPTLYGCNIQKHMYVVKTFYLLFYIHEKLTLIIICIIWYGWYQPITMATALQTMYNKNITEIRSVFTTCNTCMWVNVLWFTQLHSYWVDCRFHLSSIETWKFYRSKGRSTHHS